MKIELINDGSADNEMTLADFLRKQGIRLVLPCGGMGSCGGCHINVRDGSGSRQVLACQTRIGDLTGDKAEIDVEPDQIADIPEVSSEGQGKRQWYAATDLGSTTIETAAVSPDGSIIGSVRLENPQRTYGADVLSRIKAASAGSIAGSDMQRLAESTIQGELSMLAGRYGLIGIPKALAVAANTTMGHLLAGDDVSPLGHAPFDPGDIGLRDLTDLFFLDNGRAYLLPGISAFVGGDIVSGIYSLDMDRDDSCTLLLDLGTNGEMAVGNRDGFVVASTAAGPAFEAANISCGCAGIAGAIREVSFVNGRVRLSLIPWEEETAGLSPGELMQRKARLSLKRPAGLCGSGLISAVASMKREGIIDQNGTYVRDEWIKRGYPLWRGRGGDDIRLLQDDIRELLMAKAAISAGLTVLLHSLHMHPVRVYLAGGFGEGLSVPDAIDIGLFPEELNDTDIIPCGNTSLKGAVSFLSEREDAGERMKRICSISREVRLGDSAEFAELYIRKMKI